MSHRVAARRKPKRRKLRVPVRIDPLCELKAEVVALGEHVIAMRRELREAVTPTPIANGDDDLIGVVEAAEVAQRSEQTLRRWADAGVVGRYNASLGLYLFSRRELRAHVATIVKNGSAVT
jgi:hypothetical protein